MASFSVILPNYNHGKFLKQRIDSILEQTWKDFELIILDDHSNDNSKEVIDSYGDHPAVKEIIYNTNNSGSPFKQWLKGMELATKDWIWIAESDDFADVQFLEKVSAAISEHPDCALVYSDSYIVGDDSRVVDEKFSLRKQKIFQSDKWQSSYCNQGIKEINECLKFDCTVNNVSSMVFKKAVADPFVKALDAFTYYGDWYFIIRLCMKADICYLNLPLNYYRSHPFSHLHSVTSLLVSRIEYFRILKLLYYCNEVTGKQALIKHFTVNYLSFGLYQDGLKKGFQIISSYLAEDKRLAVKVILSMTSLKLLKKKWRAEDFFKTIKR